MAERTKRVLIADNSDAFVMYLGIFMRRLGFQVVPAESGIEVLQLTKIVTPDLLILDAALQPIGGLETLRHIKDVDRLANVPAVLVSPSWDDEMEQGCQQLGCSAFIQKPIGVERLYRMVSDLLKWPGGKKRTKPRVAYAEKVLVDVPPAVKGVAYHSVTLSEGGIYLRTQRPLSVGSQVLVSLRLADKDFIVSGTVIYTKDVYSGLSAIDPGMAIAFTEVSEEFAGNLKDFILQSLVGDLLEEQTELVLSPI